MESKTLYEVCAAAGGRLTITGHERADVDSVVSCVLMKHLLEAWGLPCTIALDAPDGQSRRVLAHMGVDVEALAGETRDEDAVILVDAYRMTRPGRVMACVDHHPTDCPPERAYSRIEACGACAVLVLRLMQAAGVPVTEQDERLAVTALYLDTIALKSAKITREEAAWGERETIRLGLDVDWLRREGMGLQDMSRPVRELAMLGRKDYAFFGRRVISTYVQTDAMVEPLLSELLGVLREACVREGATLWVFLVHDPVRMRTTEFDVSAEGVQRIEYGFLASRGQNVMPRVERMMRKGERDVSAGIDGGA
ncbi:MAG: DHH family phosphoesterase [Christensenellales bacterium]|nr:DHH family phosphoesterase [Christensenellales bacterium]